MNELQQVQLDILKEFSRVTGAGGLTWFAMFGTLLGASRHGGFIPWDTDVDVVMPRPEYDRLRARPELFGEPYFLQTTANDPGAAPRFMRLMRTDTAYINDFHDFPSQLTRCGRMGIFMDIIPLDTAPDTAAAQGMQCAASTLNLQMLGSAAFDENDENEGLERRCYELGGIRGQYAAFAELFEKSCSQFSSGRYYAMPVLGGERGFRVYDRKWFADTAEMNFEGMRLPVPAEWEKALLVAYPEGLYEREAKYRSTQPVQGRILDTRRSYRSYTGRYTDMLDGIEGKKVFVFGAGDSLRIWLERYGEGLDVACAFDNSALKWGTTAYGVPVRSPAELPGLVDDGSRLIIASIYHKEIGKQLDDMNMRDYFVFIDGWKYRRAGTNHAGVRNG